MVQALTHSRASTRIHLAPVNVAATVANDMKYFIGSSSSMVQVEAKITVHMHNTQPKG